MPSHCATVAGTWQVLIKTLYDIAPHAPAQPMCPSSWTWNDGAPYPQSRDNGRVIRAVESLQSPSSGDLLVNNLLIIPIILLTVHSIYILSYWSAINHSILIHTCWHLSTLIPIICNCSTNVGHLLNGFHTHWKPHVLSSIILQTPEGVCNSLLLNRQTMI